MSRPSSSQKQLTLGVVLGIVLGVWAITWLAGAGLDNARQTAADQRSVVTLLALADLVGATEAVDGDVQRAVERFVAGHDEVVSARVVDMKKRSLVASTVAEEGTEGLPQRLERKNPAHKEWYDLGQELRAAVDANHGEGRKWKEEISVAVRDGGTSDLAAPVEDDEGTVRGVVLLSSRASAPEVTVAIGGPWLAAFAGIGLFLLLVLALRQRPGARMGVAALCVVSTLVIAAVAMLSSLSRARVAVEAGIGDDLVAAAESFRAIGGEIEGFDATAVDPARWDADRYRTPRALISADGKVDEAAVLAGFGDVRSRFRTSFAVLGLLAFGFAAFVALGWASRFFETLRRHREAYAYVAPAMVGMLILVFFPFLYGLTLSFTDQTLYNLDEPIYSIWTGFDNYLAVLTDFELVRTIEGERNVNYENFYYTLFFTIVWTVTNVVIGVSVGLFLALILNTKGLAMRPLYRVLLILPWAIPNYITSLIWRGMFHQQFGVVNQMVQTLGFEPVAWFDTPFTSFLTVLATNAWLSFPFMMVVSLGALQSIPSDLYEAARVDGAGRWQQFQHITLPSLKPALVPAVILSVVWTFNQFNVIFLVSGGQPAGSTEILITQAYKIAFEQYRYGYAAAYATVIFGILLIYGTWQNRVTKATEGV